MRVEEISSAYGISRHHLVKVVQLLVGAGTVRSERGRGGGLRLAVPADQVNVGKLVRLTEPSLNLVECFDKATNTCPIAPSCGLKGALSRANEAFYAELDKHTVADFLPNRERLLPLWRKELRANDWSYNDRA